jgi:hypothetical protein
MSRKIAKFLPRGCQRPIVSVTLDPVVLTVLDARAQAESVSRSILVEEFLAHALGIHATSLTANR